MGASNERSGNEHQVMFVAYSKIRLYSSPGLPGFSICLQSSQALLMRPHHLRQELKRAPTLINDIEELLLRSNGPNDDLILPTS